MSFPLFSSVHGPCAVSGLDLHLPESHQRDTETEPQREKQKERQTDNDTKREKQRLSQFDSFKDAAIRKRLFPPTLLCWENTNCLLPKEIPWVSHMGSSTLSNRKSTKSKDLVSDCGSYIYYLHYLGPVPYVSRLQFSQLQNKGV